ncbi:MAG: hypothetical protein QM529_06965 [Hydrotalea sp.]|nr:hypothetical protein [Hydrotalea sp.]
MADKNNDKKYELEVVSFQEDGVWIVQCFNKDIASFGKTEDMAIESFSKIVKGQTYFDEKRGMEPLSSTPKTPTHVINEIKRINGLIKYLAVIYSDSNEVEVNKLVA